jgi:hypothetical protein
VTAEQQDPLKFLLLLWRRRSYCMHILRTSLSCCFICHYSAQLFCPTGTTMALLGGCIAHRAHMSANSIEEAMEPELEHA